MKGRRRARRTALQALYELDQSQHDLDRVLEARMRDFHVSAAAGALDRDARTALEKLLDDSPGDAVTLDGVDVLVKSYGVAPETAERVVAFVERMRPHAAYTVTMVRGVQRDKEQLDVVIERIAPEWPVEQMAPVDRNVLRIALWEIATGSSPMRVAISEAVELARTFSGEGARRMVNGALGAYASGDQHLVLEPHEGTSAGA